MPEDISSIALFSLAFIPLFVAMEPVGVLPIYLSMTQPLSAAEKKKVLLHSLITATVITLAFLLLGKAVFIALGITVHDFQIAGGLVLLCIAISDIVMTARGRPDIKPASGVGIVPIGTPLIAGPAALTTLLMLNDLYGFPATLAALGANLVIIWFFFLSAEAIIKYIGESGARGISKVISLLLAAIAVMMIRKGMFGLKLLAMVERVF
ncbi:MAG: MarC family protein [Deltaproteobacteria bacterium]|nr:MarC family protein [Deltaproteobacteria bacterium]